MFYDNYFYKKNNYNTKLKNNSMCIYYMRSIIIALFMIPVSNALWHFFFYQPYMKEFNDFVNKYNKTYDTWDEYLKAYGIFEMNYIVIKNMNYNYNYLNLEINEFSDIHPKDFHMKKKGYSSHKQKTGSCESFVFKNNTLPLSVDWRNENAVTPVKNQGQCGSCWSFSATGAMEGAWAIYSGDLVSLSEQQLMDCSKKYGDFGCNGGLMDSAFEYAIDNGMCSEDEDPYKGSTDSCITPSLDCDRVAKFSHCVDIDSENELELKEAVSLGPVSVAIEADTSVFQFYSGGIIKSSNCGESLDHGVLVVGYGEEDGEKYWIVKNSWGESWGENGYVRIARTDSVSDSGVCGIALQASYPVV